MTTTDLHPTVDPRGLRFAASLTTFVLVLVLVTPEPTRWLLLAAQTAVFALAAGLGVRYSPYGLVFATLVRPRLKPATEFEDPRPPRFAQAVGLAFGTGALISAALGATTVALIFVGFALVAAGLQAALGICLGCELYLLLRRLGPSPS